MLIKSGGGRCCPIFCAGGIPGYTASMTKQILYVGDTALREAASYLAGVMQHFGVTFDYVASDQPFPPLEGAGYGGVILSDYPSRMFVTQGSSKSWPRGSTGAWVCL